MAPPFLFINEDQISFIQQNKGVSSLVRGHARRYGQRSHSRRKHYTLPTRTIYPKELEPTVAKEEVILTPPHHDEETEAGEDLFASFDRILDIVPGQILRYRMLQLDSEARQLIHFYLLWKVPDANSRLPSELSWPEWIVSAAFNNELHSLVLPCYIASMVSYLSQSPTGLQKELSKSNRQVWQPTFWPSVSESYFECDSPRSSQSSASPLHYRVDHSSSPYPMDLWETWQNSPMSEVFQTPSTQTFATQNGLEIAPQHDLPPLLSNPSQLVNDGVCFPVAFDLAGLTHSALVALQSRLSTKNKSSFSTSFSSDLLLSVWCLFRAAIFQGDELAAVSHERFLRQLIYRPDGSKYFSSRLIKVIVDVDLKLSLARQEIGVGDKRSSALLVKSELRERTTMVS
jgi:hypothetical protein